MEKYCWAEQNLSNREKTIKKLKESAIKNFEVRQLLKMVEENIGEVILENPNSATKYFINKYNNLVMSSNLEYAERKKFLLE